MPARPCHYVYDTLCMGCAQPRILLVSTQWSLANKINIGYPQPSDKVRWAQGVPYCADCGGTIATGDAFRDVFLHGGDVRATDKE